MMQAETLTDLTELEQAVHALRFATSELRVKRTEFRQAEKDILRRERRIAELRLEVERQVQLAVDPPTMAYVEP